MRLLHQKALLEDPAALKAILAEWAQKARYAASKTINKVRKKVGTAY